MIDAWMRPCRSFQSTLPRGERPVKSKGWLEPSKFQSTLPRGERPGGGLFNLLEVLVSIHAPARGATNAAT